MTFGARARIRLDAIRHNLKVIRGHSPGAKVMAIIKANAYGHGLLAAARAMGTVDSLAVARLPEARVLLEAGVTTPIVLLGGVLSPSDLDDAVSMGIHLGVHTGRQLEWLEECSERAAMLWIKVDTGMHRLGFPAEDDLSRVVERLKPRAERLGLMTHFANADDLEDATTSRQMDAFLSLVADFDGEVSVANSPSLLGWPDLHAKLDELCTAGRLWIRPGLSLFGISPFADRVGSDLGLEAAMQFEATLMAVKRLRAGSPVGYGGAWTSPRDTTLGIVAAGYGDGYTRYIPSGTPVLVNGRRVPVAGRISMDMTAVDLGPDADDRVGDPVLLWGEGLPVEEVARCADTISYQLVTGVTHREAAVYEG